MWNPINNSLPKCKWPDHDWQLKEHLVVSYNYRLSIAEVFECPKCKRLRVQEMSKEPA